jgi:F-type H+-transporting ATPase subunit b
LISVDLTAFVIMALVFALVLALKHLFFEPLAQAMETREARVSRAEGAWDDAQKTIRDANQQVTAAVQSARNEGYVLLDEARAGAQAKARAGVDESRDEAQRQIAEARARLQAETDGALKSLEAQAEALAASLAGRILGRNV